MAKYGYIPNFRSRSNERLNRINSEKQLTLKLSDNERIEKEKEENLIAWITYFRQNPARFAVEYLGMNHLTSWQRFLLHMMFQSSDFLWIASRGLGKTYLVWVYCVVRCILYPGTKIVYTSITGGAAVSYMQEKVRELSDSSSNIECEIEKIETSGSNPGVFFKNGSYTVIRPPSKNALGARANVIVIDEYRQVDDDVIEQVFQKFLTAPRRPRFLSVADEDGELLYKDYPLEKNIEIYISSQSPTYEPGFTRYSNTLKNMFRMEDVTALCMPYYLGMKDGIITKEAILKDLEKEGADLSVFALEYECVPYGSSEGAYFTNEMFSKNRNVLDIFIPMPADEYIANMGDLSANKFYIPKKEGEIRLLAVDTALSSASSSANTIIEAIRLIPSEVKRQRTIEGKRTTYVDRFFEKHIVYIKNVTESMDPDYQAMMIKRTFYLFEADYIAIDTHGASLGVIYSMVKPTYDSEYNKEYFAFDSVNDEDTTSKCKAPMDERERVMYNIKVAGASAQDVQHRYNTYTRSELLSNRIKFPATRSNGETHLREKYDYDLQNAETQAEWVSVYIQCDALIAEAVNLVRRMTGTLDRVILEIPSRSTIKRRDRIIALQYGLLYAQELELEAFKHKNKLDYSNYSLGSRNVPKRIERGPFGSRGFDQIRGFGWRR